MGLNREGFVLLSVFAYLLVLLFYGFGLYGRRDWLLMGGHSGFLKDSLAYFGASPLLLVLFALPELILSGGLMQLLTGVSLLLGCSLLPLLYRKLQACLRDMGAVSVLDLIRERFGLQALAAVSSLCILFSAFLFAGCAASLARLFSSAMYLSYSLSVVFSTLLLLLLALLSSPPVQRRHMRLLAVALPLALACLAALLVRRGGALFRLPVGEYRPVSLFFSSFIGLGALGSIPLLHNLPQGYGRKRTALFVILQLLFWILCVGAAVVSALFSGQKGGGESVLLLAAQDGFSPLLSALLLTGFASAGFTCGTGALDSARIAAEEGCALLFPLTEAAPRRWISFFVLVFTAALSLLLSLQQEMGIYRMISVGWAGMAGVLAPFLVLTLTKRRVRRPAICVLAPVLAACVALLFGLLPSLFGLAHPVAPALASSLLLSLPFSQRETRETPNGLR